MTLSRRTFLSHVRSWCLAPVYLRSNTAGMAAAHVPLVTEAALRKAVMVNVSRTGLIAILDGEDVVMRDLPGKEVNRLRGKGYDRATRIAFSADGKNLCSRAGKWISGRMAAVIPLTFLRVKTARQIHHPAPFVLSVGRRMKR